MAALTALDIKGSGKIGASSKYLDNYDGLISTQRQGHILYGDETGGGHLAGAGKGKPEFPKSWSNKQVLHNTADIATDPGITWTKDTAWKGKYARYIADGIRDNVNMRVIIEPKGEGIITGYPLVTR
ncbi:MAG: EndoU domain-containing protein [Candidatus Komeilibacteria bacterium]|nr:EndoU domain-containing protein [Candidatus Komeilibacteria bacterium]